MCRLTELFDHPLYYNNNITDNSKEVQEDSDDVQAIQNCLISPCMITDSSKVAQEDSGDVQTIQNCLISPSIIILQTAVKWPRRTLVMCRLYRSV